MLILKLCSVPTSEYDLGAIIHQTFQHKQQSSDGNKKTETGWFQPTDRLWRYNCFTSIILGMGSASERWRYYVTSSFIGTAHTRNDLCFGSLATINMMMMEWTYWYKRWWYQFHTDISSRSSNPYRFAWTNAVPYKARKIVEKAKPM